ncbi:MAG: biotin--[acetyl-CoA-carboxylase] ligase [Phycisphaeraceae bacterium]|nr:biotin--[acetyl-CoA-carboxylase] ligase [Phycisphaeraceae bacterium]
MNVAANKAMKALDARMRVPTGPHEPDPAPLETWTDYLQWRLGADRTIAVYRQTASTQEVIRRLLSVKAPRDKADGAVAAADRQSAGRGRLGRAWSAPAGSSVLVSVGLVHETRINELTLASAVAVAQAVEAVAQPKIAVGIKWPNDLLVDGHKLAGILVETFRLKEKTPAAIIGIGVNVSITADQWPREAASWKTPPTSLAMLGRHAHRLLLLARIVEELDAVARAPDDPDVLDQWRRRSTLAGQDVTLQHDGRTVRGHVMDIDPHEGLILRTEAGTIRHFPAATTTVM